MAKSNVPKKGAICSFCGRMQPEVQRIITGPAAAICNECVDICAELLRQDKVESVKKV